MNYASLFFRGTLEIRAYEGTTHAGKVKAYVLFSLALAAKALNSRAASSKKRAFDPKSARYDMRVFLLHLGMVGDEFKVARKHLLAALPGDSAFKSGRPKRSETRGANLEDPKPNEPRTEGGIQSGESPAFELVAVLNAAEAASATEAGIETRPLVSSGEPTAAEEAAAETGGAE